MAVQFDPKISFGNVLTLIAMLVSVLAGWSKIANDQVKVAEKVETIETQMNAKTALRDRQMDGHEARIRSVEIAQASQSSDLRSIQLGISEIKAQLDKLSRQ